MHKLLHFTRVYTFLTGVAYSEERSYLKKQTYRSIAPLQPFSSLCNATQLFCALSKLASHSQMEGLLVFDKDGTGARWESLENQVKELCTLKQECWRVSNFHCISTLLSTDEPHQCGSKLALQKLLYNAILLFLSCVCFFK